MASTLETVNNSNGSLAAKEVVDSEITKVAVQLYTMAVMMGDERSAEKELLESLRRDLFELRGYLNKHFKYEAG